MQYQDLLTPCSFLEGFRRFEKKHAAFIFNIMLDMKARVWRTITVAVDSTL
jgi:hypothetical protein